MIFLALATMKWLKCSGLMSRLLQISLGPRSLDSNDIRCFGIPVAEMTWAPYFDKDIDSTMVRDLRLLLSSHVLYLNGEPANEHSKTVKV